MYEPGTGRFDSLDPFAGNPQNPLSYNKYLYTQADPVNGTDPTGTMDLVSVGISMAIGATIGGISTVAGNYALNRPLTKDLGWGIAFGAVAAPVAVAVPLIGVGLAGYGIFQSWSLVWTVALNPRSTNGQLTAAIVLFGTSMFGGYVAGKNLVANGWYNPIFEQKPNPQGLPGLSTNSPLQEQYPQMPDNAMIHVSRVPFEQLANQGVQGSVGTGRSYWFRWSDIKHLTWPQVRSLIGDLAQGGLKDANQFVFKIPPGEGPSQFTQFGNALGAVPEYISNTTVRPDGGGVTGPNQ